MKLWVSILVALLLNACALLPRATETEPEEAAAPTGVDWETHSSNIATLKAWFLKGRIALRTEQEGWNATLHWRQEGPQYSLRVLAPLGQGTVELFGREDVDVTLITSDNERYSARDPEALMQERLGWSVPVAGLKYWVRGLPKPGSRIVSATPDSEGRLATLDQSGWHIEIQEYTEALGRDLPRKLEMANDRFELKLVVQSWESLDG